MTTGGRFGAAEDVPTVEAGSRLLSSILAALTGPLLAAPGFVSADTCALCHSRAGMRTQAPVGHYESWRFSMMSAAARDPYWRSRVAMESGAAGGEAAKVQDKCLRCHAAADQYAFRSESKQMRIADLTDSGGEGVTCTVCHRIEPVALGKRESFTGGFRISKESVIFGPHERPFAMPMMHHTGYQPVPAKHILDAALCGSCHTLLLTDSAGQVTLPEQTTYLEWLASEYPSRNTACQTCHLPVAKGADGEPASDYIAHRPQGGAFPPTRPRSPIGVHTFIGGNVQMLRLLAESGDSAGFRERADATQRFLTSAIVLNATATVDRRDLLIGVTIRNLTGHKLPTGHARPATLAPCHCHGFSSRIVFESGAWNPDTGELRFPQSFQPHRDLIDRSAQTAIYEAVIEDAGGKLTSLLTKAVRYRKDNRLLPEGFDQSSRLPDGVLADWVMPVGTKEDQNFEAGHDTVHYRIPLPKNGIPVRISVEACFQSIRPVDAASVAGLPRGPVVIATAEAIVASGR